MSRPIRDGMPVYPGDPEVRVERVRDVGRGDPYSLSALALGSHTGTHVDAPAHFLAGGAGVDALPLDALLGAAWVADAPPGEGVLGAREIESMGIPGGTERLLIRTAGSGRTLSPEGAGELIHEGLRLVGIDAPSIAPSSDPAPTHVVLLTAGVVIVEGLDLMALHPGLYELVCAPLLVAGADGAPARVVVRPSPEPYGPS